MKEKRVVSWARGLALGRCLDRQMMTLYVGRVDMLRVCIIRCVNIVESVVTSSIVADVTSLRDNTSPSPTGVRNVGSQDEWCREGDAVVRVVNCH